MDAEPKPKFVESLVKTVEDISGIPEYRNAYKKLFFNLARRIKLLLPMFEELRESKEEVSENVLLPLSKALESAKELLRLGSEGSRISLVLKRDRIMKWFQEVTNQLEQSLAEISFDELDISDEVREQVELVHSQLKRAKERVDDTADLELYDNLVSVYNTKIDAEVDSSVLQGLAEKLQLVTISDLIQESLALHDMVLVRGGDPGEEIEKMLMLLKKIKDYMQTQNLAMGVPANNKLASKEAQKISVMQDGLLNSGEAATSAVIPDDYRCPITLELMRDPVIVSTGQTYDRRSIEKWLGAGHDTCPKTQQKLSSKSLTPNYALRSLIADWCEANGMDLPAHYGPDSEIQSSCTASEHAKVAELLDKLSSQNHVEQQSAAAEIRLLAKANSENRVCIAEAGGIPRLVNLLYTLDVETQEHVVTAILNLSIFDQNKARIISAGALPGIVHVLKLGSMSARENAAATLFSLSVVDRIKVAIGEAGAIPPLVLLLREGGQRGKKDAATALFNLCIYQGNKRRAVRAALVPALVELISDPEGALKDEALAILAILSSHPEGKAAITATEALPLLVEVIKSGSPRNKENAAAVLVHLCQGQHNQQPMAEVTGLGLIGLLQEMLETGTDRGRRKAGQLLELLSRFMDEKQEAQCPTLSEAQSEHLPAAL